VPFVVAANAPRSIALAAEYGQGWITTGAPVDDLESWWVAVADRADQVGEARAARYLMLDSAPVFSLSSIDAFTEAIERAAALGFTDVVTHWPRPESWYAGDEAILDDVPAVLARYRTA
jgi:alkanesulfonate monooxygenase SsuD/methylene tetrahydromethanopterin reductase-like flavin-dependent oxidoreductase (luciferase family)